MSHRPSVLITTYSSGAQQVDACATQSDLSTNLFNAARFRLNNITSNFKSNQRKVISLNLNQIKGPSGSIRGHKDVVKKSIANIKVVQSCKNRLFSISCLPANNLSSYSSLVSNQEHQSEYLDSLVEDEQDQCVVYTTSLGVLRRTFEDSRRIKAILNLNIIKYQERDIYLNQEYKIQLKLRCGSIMVPALFVDGKHFGGFKEVDVANESGRLAVDLLKFKMPKLSQEVCTCCGNAKFIACPNCNGSRKSTIHHFKFNSIALRCIRCDNNEGLVQCPICHGNSSLIDSQREAGIDLNNNNNRPIDEDAKKVSASDSTRVDSAKVPREISDR